MKKKLIAMALLAAILCSMLAVVHADGSLLADGGLLKERDVFYSNTRKNLECNIWISSDGAYDANASFEKTGIAMHSDGYAMKIKYNGLGKTGVQLIRSNNTVCDISAYKDNAYLSFWMYIETSSTVEPDARNLAVCLRSTADTNYASTNYYNLSADVKAGSWNHILIPVAEMGIDTSRGEIDFSKLYRIDVKRNAAIEEDWNVYVQDISFYEKFYPPTVTVAERGMNADNGMFYTTLQFSNAMDATTLTADQFTLQGTPCSAVSYDADTKSCVLQFDTMPARKTALTLSLGDGIQDIEGLAPQTKAYTVQLSAGQEEVAASIAAAPSILNGTLSCTASVRRIYAPEAGKVTAFLALYQDDCMVAYSITEYGEMAWKSSATKTLTLEVPKEVSDGTLRAELYFIDTEAGGRPLAKVLQYEL